jgi:8-oxo-dGTP pyrophosphatase MutT (NUDIX family)
MFKQRIKNVINFDSCRDEKTFNRFIRRLDEENYTRDENPQSHFCVYFLPYNRDGNKVFLVHHKKSGLWLSPGGHIDKDESLLQALNREISEELGVNNFFSQIPIPFLFTITPISNIKQSCKEHFDIWFLIPTDGTGFNINPEEFFDTKWLTIDEAKTIVVDLANRQALEIIKKRAID